MSTPAQFKAWETRASATQGDERLEQLRRVSVEALSASDLARADRWMALYAREIEARRSVRHGRALAQLKAYKIGIEGDFSGAAAELTRMMAGERDPFLRAAGARLLAYSLTDAGLPVQALQVIRSGLRDADLSDEAPALRLGLADAGAYASRELNDLPAFIDNIEIGIKATQQAHQPIDGRTTLFNLTILTSAQGRVDLSKRLLEQYQRLAAATGDHIEIGWANELCAKVNIAGGGYAAALGCAEAALTNADIAPEHRPKVMLIQVMALARLGRPVEARKQLGALTALARERGDPLLMHDIQQGEAEVLRSEGRVAEAYETLLKFHDQKRADTAASVVEGLHGIRASLENEIDETQALLAEQRRQTLWISLLVGFVALALIGAVVSLVAQRRLQRRLVKAAARAEHADKVKSEFLANLSHEIRTPLTSIVGFSRLLADQPNLTPESAKFANRIVTATQSLLAIVNDVLDFSKIEAGQARIEPRPTALAGLIQDVSGLFSAQAAEKGVTLTVDMADCLPAWTLVDPDRVRQVLLNLLGNAVKFTAAGEVRVAAGWSQTDGLRVEVIDSGAGISEEGQARLFRRFSQVHGAAGRMEGGTGLGLAICSGLVEAMGGEIGVESTVGEGSRFWFQVPAPIAEAPRAAEPLELAPGGLSDRARVLVVDDNEANRELVSHLLASLDLDLTFATRGEEAVLAADVDVFDLILMDIRMPGMGGEAAMGRIRSGDGPNADAPILAFTADVDGQATERLLGAGFDGHVHKPIDPRGLITSVVQWTARAA
ncbi:MAG: response regulator [Caulobacterales bacterium]|nr:response regulator [Caulobacterales bacterium]